MTHTLENHRIDGEWFAFRPDSSGWSYHDAIPEILRMARIPFGRDAGNAGFIVDGSDETIRVHICEPDEAYIEDDPHCFAVGMIRTGADGADEVVEYQETTDPSALVRIVRRMVEEMNR